MFLGCWVVFWGGWELVAFLFCWAAGECGFRKADWWFPNLCLVSSCAQRINNRKTGKQAVQDEESTRGISKEEQPQVLHQWHQFLNKSTNLKTHGMSWRWRTFHHMAAFLPSIHFIGYQWCHLLRHPKGLARTRWLGLMAYWLDYLCWFHAGLRRRKTGSVNPRDGTGWEGFLATPNDVEVNVVSPGVFFVFFSPVTFWSASF